MSSPHEELMNSLPEDLRGCIMSAADLPEEPAPAQTVRITLEAEPEQLTAFLRDLSRTRRSHHLTPGQKDEILRRLGRGESRAALADEFGVCRETIRNLINAENRPERG
jgi:hypothetical protein